MRCTAAVAPLAPFASLAAVWKFAWLLPRWASGITCVCPAFHLLAPCRAAGVFSRLPCNAFAFCSEDKCFEPDAHT